MNLYEAIAAESLKRAAIFAVVFALVLCAIGFGVGYYVSTPKVAKLMPVVGEAWVS
jgi:uncharacterized membrane protein